MVPTHHRHLIRVALLCPAVQVPTMATVLASTHFSERPSFPADLEVLLLDSATQGAETASKLLLSCSYRVTVCRSVSEALSHMACKAFDVVLVEQKLFSGRDAAAAQLKALAGVIPTVVLSDSGSAKDTWAAIVGQAADVLIRPLTKQKLQTLWQHTVRMQRAASSASAATSMVAKPVAVLSSALKPAASSASLDKGQKRKLKDVCGPLAAARPPLAVKPNMVLSAAPAHIPRPIHPPAVMGYWPQHMMGPIMAHPQVSNPGFIWGAPVMGVPAGQQGAPFVSSPQMPMQIPHAMQAGCNIAVPGQPVGSQPMIVQAAPHGRVVHALPAPQKSEAPVTPQKPGSEMHPELDATKVIQEPLSPSQSAGSFYALSDASSGSHIAMGSSDNFNIPVYESGTDSQESQPTCDPTSLDDINEDDYAFIDFALSDSFPTVEEDEILPPIGLSLKKSSSLLNMLNVQMVH